MLNFIKKPLVAAATGLITGVIVDEVARLIARKVAARKAQQGKTEPAAEQKAA